MFETWFIKNKKLLEENSRTENLIDLTSEIERFSVKLDNIEFSSIVWFIGKFWSWKSNFLNQIKEKYQEKSKWFEFDAWKYPERHDLWENFVLDIAEKISEKDFTKSIRKIEGKNPTVWVEKLTKFCAGIWIWNFSDLLNSSPTRRVIELQSMFLNLLSHIEEKNIYIIIEDIDRSWDNWIFFLETLNHFLKNNEIDKKIIVIVPIWEENYNKEDVKLSYLKSLDYFHHYSLKEVKLELLVKELFLDEIFNNNNLKWQVISFLEWIFKEFSEQITMRLLKHILRNANSNYIALLNKQWEWIDWRLSIVFETAKYIKYNDWEFYINNWRISKQIWWNESIFSAFINCVFQENHRVRWQMHNDIYEEDYSWDIKIIKPRKLSYKVPLKLISHKYSSSQVKDAVLYFSDNFDRDNSYLWIIEDYLD